MSMWRLVWEQQLGAEWPAGRKRERSPSCEMLMTDEED